jgi:CspA family cold shock protein
MPFGIVKWWTEERSFGFISPEDGGRDLYVDYRGLRAGPMTHLNEGDRVSYEVAPGPKGEQAVDVAVAE